MLNDQGLAHLTKLKNLKTLAYDGTAITAAGIQNLKKFIPGLNEIQPAATEAKSSE
jgi:hypothetical protein